MARVFPTKCTACHSRDVSRDGIYWHCNTCNTNGEAELESYVPAVAPSSAPARQGEVLPAEWQRMTEATEAMLPDYSPAMEAAHALQAIQSAKETSTPLDRANATNRRMAGLALASGLVCLALYVAGASAAFAAIGFAVLVVVTVGWIIRLDHEHSPSGVERQKVRTYKDIRQTEINTQAQVAQMKMQVYMNVLERIYPRAGDDERSAD